jgi:hypothetical protein
MPPRRIGKTPDRHFRIPDEEYDPAQDRAEREGRTLTWIVRHAFRLYVRGELPMPGDGKGPAPEVGEGAGPGLYQATNTSTRTTTASTGGPTSMTTILQAGASHFSPNSQSDS